MRAANRLAAVHVVTAEEAAAGAYDIADVVLPLPGARIRYPDHDTAQVCKVLLSCFADAALLMLGLHHAQKESVAIAADSTTARRRS